MTPLKTLLQSPLFNISGLEKGANIPPRTLHQYLNGTKGLADRHLPEIVKQLKTLQREINRTIEEIEK